MVFKSKINSDLKSQILTSIGGLAVCIIFSGNRPGLVILIYLLMLGFTYFFFKTRYSIDSKTIVIKNGFFKVDSISIGQIVSISEIKNNKQLIPIFPDKLEIKCKRSNTYYLYPIDQSRFIDEVYKLNPQIHIKSDQEVISA